MAEISDSTKNLIARLNLWQKSKHPKAEPAIHVDEVASRVAAFYERVRTVIEWKEEHLMRRSAIIRKIKRRFLNLEINNYTPDEDMAESLVSELIRGGHFPNDALGESKIAEVKEIINKYIFILKNSPENKKGRAGIQFYNWLLEVAACEIEETLCPSEKEMALIDYMFELMKERIKVSESIYEKGLLKKEETDVQIYIAIQQALFKFDKPIISYNLIKYKYPKWEKSDEETLVKISQNAVKIFKKIEKDMAHPLARKFYAVCEKYDTPYLLLGDILGDDTENIAKQIAEPSVLEGMIKSAYIKRLSTLKARLNRAAIYSTVSIFITKILSLLLLEIILSKIFTGHLNRVVLVSDILVPTFLMFFMVATIKKPSKKNLGIVILETMKIVYQKEKPDIYEIKTVKKRNFATRAIISLIYSLGAVVSFGAIVFVFLLFKFPITSIIINLIFIALIVFAGMAIRKRAQELTIDEGNETFFGFMSDVLFLPMAGLGQWLSSKWKKYNAIAAFFNALIDMPFSIFVEFIEKWRFFIKEKKEEIH